MKSRVLISVWISVSLLIGVIFLMPRHRKIDFVKESGIDMHWDSKEENYRYSAKDWESFQSFLKKRGFAYEGSADYAAQGQGLTGTNFWKKGDLYVEEGQVPDNKNECFVRGTQGL